MPGGSSNDATSSFEDLAGLRVYLEELLDAAVSSLTPYHVPSTGGFAHRIQPESAAAPADWSKASTATCVAFLAATGRLDEGPWAGTAQSLAKEIAASDWNSADLGPGNPFTTSFLLEALADLGGDAGLPPSKLARVHERIQQLTAEVSEDIPRLLDYPPTAFLTYKAVSALARWGVTSHHENVDRWNWTHLYKESALVAAGSPDADVFEIAYSVLIANAIKPLDAMTPQQRHLLGFGLVQFFDAQRQDGTWPRSRPLFVYPKLGHAYCFEYELLAAILSSRQLRQSLQEHLSSLRRAARALDAKKYPLERAGDQGETAYGWSSGHHGADPEPESWSTASALHFCFGLNELIAEAIRRRTFEYVAIPYSPPRAHPASEPFFPPSRFLDSDVNLESRSESLTAVMTERLVQPLIESQSALDRGRALPEDVPTSAILYGPPGTSKTELSKLIADALGWPLLALDPANLTRHGLDNVHAEANTVFGMLEQCERIVVLLDEFDELVRDRDKPGELESRFLTTAMLPKLQALSRRRRIVYLVATNHLEQFDAAIRRPGRFDLILPVMPPTLKAKLKKWPVLDAAIAQIKGEKSSAGTKARKQLTDLTFLESKELAKTVEGLTDPEELRAAFTEAADRCTLRQDMLPPKEDDAPNLTWKEQIEAQREKIRGV